MDENKNKTDEEIVELVRSGDKEMYTLIIRRYQLKLLRYANYLIGDSDRAADAVQDSFIKAYMNLKGFNINKKFSSWIYRIVHNEAMNLVDKHKKHISLSDGMDFEDVADIEDVYMKGELAAYARECLEQMDLIYREPLSLYYLEEKSYEEISDILRLPMGTVATRINRAKVIMRKICQKKM